MRPYLQTVPLGLLAWLLIVVFWLTWTPLTPLEPRLRWQPPGNPTEILVNLCLFMPVSGVIAVVAGRHTGESRALLVTTGTVALLSGLVELGQFVVPGRTISVSDVVLNTMGGAFVAILLLLPKSRIGRERGILKAIGGTVFVAVFAALLIGGTKARKELRMSKWNPGFEIAAGRELDGERIYQGSIRGAYLCAGAGPERVCAGPGDPQQVRRQLSIAAQQSQHLSLFANVTSRLDTQSTRLARIITFSRDTSARNATVGQAGQDIVLRVRTPLTGSNGSAIEFILPDAVQPAESTRVTAHFTPESVRITARSATQELAATYTTGLLRGWWLVKSPSRQNVEPRDLAVAGALGAVLLAFPVGLGVASLLQRPRPVALAAAPVAAIGMLYIADKLLLTGPLVLRDVAIVAICAVVGVLVGWWDSSRIAPE